MPTSSTLTIPNTFEPRTPASSADMNANFAAVATLINTTGLGTNNIKDGTVTSELIAEGAITNPLIEDETIPRSKLAPVEQQSSSFVSSFSTTSATEVDVTNLSVSITTSGRPVFVGLRPSNGALSSVAGTANTRLFIVRGSSTHVAEFVAGPIQSPSAYYTVDEPAAGSYTYKITAQSDGSDTLTVANSAIQVFEL